MNDEAIDAVNAFSASGHTSGLGEDPSSSSDIHVLYTSVSDTILGLIFCFCVLAGGCYMSHLYKEGEREERDEAEQLRAEAEMKKIEDMETYRSKIATVVDNHAIHLTNTTSRYSSRTIPNGTDDDTGENDDALPTTEITIKTAYEDEDEEDIEDIEESMRTENNNSSSASSSADTSECTCTCPSPCTSLSSSSNEDDKEVDQQREQEQVPSLSSSSPSSSSLSSSASMITHSNLREAVSNNPCAICMEPFKAGNDIVSCSNNIRGMKPHCFHRHCTLEYLVTHTDGIQAPCPCCRKVFFSSEGQRKGSLSHTHYHSCVTLTDLDQSSDDIDDEEQ